MTHPTPHESPSIAEIMTQAFEAFDAERFGEAEALYRRALTQLADPAAPTYRDVLHMLAFVKSSQGDYPEARGLYTGLLADARARHDMRAISISLHQLGMVERLAGDLRSAQQYFDEEYAHLKAHLPDFWAGWSANAYERGCLGMLAGRFDEAEGLLQEALTLGERGEDAMCRACVLRGLGEVARRQGRDEAAREWFRQSATAFRQAGDERGAADVERTARG